MAYAAGSSLAGTVQTSMLHNTLRSPSDRPSLCQDRHAASSARSRSGTAVSLLQPLDCPGQSHGAPVQDRMPHWKALHDEKRPGFLVGTTPQALRISVHRLLLPI